MKKIAILCLLFVVALAPPLLAADVATMEKDELKGMLGSEDLVILDVRAGRDWSSSQFMIKGAVREDPGAVSDWSGKYDKGKTFVLYCA